MFLTVVQYNRFIKHYYYLQFDKIQPHGDLRKLGNTSFEVHTVTLSTMTLH